MRATSNGIPSALLSLAAGRTGVAPAGAEVRPTAQAATSETFYTEEFQ
ncbi:MAG: hypothetical protein HYR55_17075 [Acidobacteria bacterium]|nr:hypothetical protein [Acidobacteriota bacterium]MBI3655502.1 hypothetical protein [Acidobacteriota bacterium]